MLFLDFYRPRHFLLGLAHLGEMNMWTLEFCTCVATGSDILRGCSVCLRESQSGT